MITVPLPRLLDANLQEVRRLYPLAASITLVAQGAGEASLTLAAGDPRPAMHQWVQLFTQHGSAGFYRVTGISNTYTGDTQITLRHGIDTLSDSVYSAQAEEATVTVRQFLTNILSYQTARVAGRAPWQLGVCEDTTSVKRAFNYDNLAELLRGLEDEKQNFYFTYDFATTPWTLNFVRKPAEVACEFRLSRNIEGVTVTLDDSELCTQLLLSVNVMTTTTPTSSMDPDVDWPTITANDSTVRTYNNAAAQAEWGIVQKTASIDTQDDIVGQEFPDADAWAARFMADHSQPTLQIQITGEDLYEITGDTFDELRLAALCRAALPDHDALFAERVVSVTYPDIYGTPTSVTVSLANRLPRFSNSIAQAQKEAAKADSTAKTAKRSAGGGGGGTAKELESWAMIVKKTKESADVTGLTELAETGIILDAETGAKIYSLNQGFVSQYAELNVQSGRITAVAQSTDALDNRVSSAEVEIDGTNAKIALKANQTEVDNLTSRVSQAEIDIDGANAQIALKASQSTVDALGERVSQAEIDINGAEAQIALKVNKGNVSTQLAIECGNVTVSGGNLVVDGYITSKGLETTTIKVAGIDCSGDIDAQGVRTSSLLIGQSDVSTAVSSIGPATASGGKITIPWKRLNGKSGTDVTFNIADTKFYKDGVSAAWTNAYNTVRINNNKNPGAGNKTINLGSGQSVEVYAQAKSNANASVWTTVGTVTVNAPTYTLGSLSIASNGIYNAPTYGYTGFSYVSVDVPTNPSITQCYIPSNALSNVTVTAKSQGRYNVTGNVTIRVDFSDGTHTTYGPYTVHHYD